MIKVHRDLQDLPRFNNAVITIGTFDGVHVGHQQIIALLKQQAASINGETVIITFHPHPRKVVAKGGELHILTTLHEKIELLDRMGVLHVVVVPFSNVFASQSAEDYIRDFLVKNFNPKVVIIGYDHRFGKDRLGDYHLLEAMGEAFDYKVKEIPEQVLNEVTVSSTKIREALLRSDVATANKFLGYQYFFSGTVVQGNKLGRTIGFATANLKIEPEEKLIPGNGVYAVDVTLKNYNTVFKGMMNIGVRPTINGINRTIEVHIFNFDEEIYGAEMRVALAYHLRSEKKFAGLDELKRQLAEDKKQAILLNP